MPGTIHIKPIEAKLTRNTSKVIGMDPYCIVKIGNKTEKSEVNYNGGIHPHWDETLSLNVENELKCLVELKDKTLILPDSSVGVVELNLKEIENKGDFSQWYILLHDNEPAGEILIKTQFEISPSKLTSPISRKNIVQEKQIIQEGNKFSRVYDCDTLGPTTEQQASLSSIDESEKTKGYDFDAFGPTTEQQKSGLHAREDINSFNRNNNEKEKEEIPLSTQDIKMLRNESKSDYSRNYDFDELGPTTEQQNCLSPQCKQNKNKGYDYDEVGPTIEQQSMAAKQ